MLQEGNKHLREMPDRLGDELRMERARGEAAVQDVEKAKRTEAAKMYHAHQEELKRLRQGDWVWHSGREELDELKEKWTREHEEEVRKIHDRRDRNERRLWNPL